MTRNLILTLVCVILSGTLFAQQYFEGEIDFKVTYQFKGKPDTSTYIPQYPAKNSRIIAKEGTWIVYWDTAKDYEFAFFDREYSRQCYKLKGYDTLLYMQADERGDGPDDSLISTRITRHAAKILGRDCDRLDFQLASMKLTLYFDPTLRIDPAWYASAKLNYYDVIYGKMKSAYVKMIWETPKFIVTTTAIRIQEREVRSEEFAKATALPVKPL
jgi:hypothetical protein